MPRRSGGGGGFRSAPSRPLRQPVSHVPAKTTSVAPSAPVALAPPMGMQPRQPGLMAQMATTAAGVAVGSAVGHTLGAAMTSGGRESNLEQSQQQQQMDSNQQQQSGPCYFQMKQFLDCAQTQHDLTLCQSFNEAFRDCKQYHGISE